MKQSIFQEKYPIFSLELDKAETNCESVDEIMSNQRCPKFHFKKPHKFFLKRPQLLSTKYLNINGYATI
jgi:hypothetical protein